jgi:hypothetical protein
MNVAITLTRGIGEFRVSGYGTTMFRIVQREDGLAA